MFLAVGLDLPQLASIIGGPSSLGIGVVARSGPLGRYEGTHCSSKAAEPGVEQELQWGRKSARRRSA